MIQYDSLEDICEEKYCKLFYPKIIKHQDSVKIDMYGRFMFNIQLREYRFCNGSKPMQFRYKHNCGSYNKLENVYQVVDRHCIQILQNKEYIDMESMFFYELK